MVPALADGAAFSPYGRIIRAETQDRKRYIENAFADSHNDLSYRLSINRIAACLDNSIDVHKLEQHPHSSQIFLPLTPGDYLTVVGLQDADGQIAIDTLRAFVLPRFSGIAYHPGTWHFAFTALREPGEVAVILGSRSGCVNTEYADLARHLTINLLQYWSNR